MCFPMIVLKCEHLMSVMMRYHLCFSGDIIFINKILYRIKLTSHSYINSDYNTINNFGIASIEFDNSIKFFIPIVILIYFIHIFSGNKNTKNITCQWCRRIRVILSKNINKLNFLKQFTVRYIMITTFFRILIKSILNSFLFALFYNLLRD